MVTEEVERILQTYPEYPYQIAFSSSGLRQELIAYVLSRILNTYTVTEEEYSSSNNTILAHYSKEQRLHLDHLIHLGIRDVLHIYNRTNCYLP